MIINASKHAKNNYTEPVIPAGQLVNILGKYLYKHLDGAYKFEKGSNMCDVYVTVLFSIPADIARKYKLKAGVNEMTLDLNITTYQNKIRLNITEITPEECTIGFDTFPPEKLQNLNDALNLVYEKVKKRVSKRYEDWDFIF